MARIALERMCDNTDALLAGTENPLHRTILINWRRHSCLEIMGIVITPVACSTSSTQHRGPES